VNAVVHIHPPTVVLFTVCDKPLLPIYGAYDPPSLMMALNGIPTYERSVLITNPELGADFVGAMGSAPLCLMRGHGITTTGRSVEEASLAAIQLNELATLNYQAHLLGGARPISEEDQAAFRRMMQREGGGKTAPDDGRPNPRAQALWRYYQTLTADR
jgi:L-fuculose-phosphate aldolase